MANINLFGKNFNFLLIFALALICWQLPPPDELTIKSWHLFIIFLSTIACLIVNPFPMAITSFFSITICLLTSTLDQKQALSGFSDSVVWLVLLAFFLSHGFTKTKLGNRIAYNLIILAGKSTLALSYALVCLDFILSPFIPSVCARGGGIIFPIAQALCDSYIKVDLDKHHNSDSANSRNLQKRPNGAFLMKVCANSNIITSATFITAMAANPLTVKLAANIGIIITWKDWALAAIVPALCSLLIMPLALYILCPPEIKIAENAPIMAAENLSKLGKISLPEIIMIKTFLLLIVLWIWGDYLSIPATTVALLGLTILLITKVISLDDCLSDKAAWNSFIWFATIVMLSSFLADFGIVNWLSIKISAALKNFSNILSAIMLILIYFYIHYFFASTTTHLIVLYPTFLTMLLSIVSFSPMIIALSLGFLSTLSGCLTHYGLSSIPIYFGAGYIKLKKWWFIGFIMSIIYLIIWSGTGFLWWKFIGLI